MSNNSHSRGR